MLVSFGSGDAGFYAIIKLIDLFFQLHLSEWSLSRVQSVAPMETPFFRTCLMCNHVSVYRPMDRIRSDQFFLRLFSSVDHTYFFIPINDNI